MVKPERESRAKPERKIRGRLFRGLPKTWVSASEEHLLASAKAVAKQPYRTDRTASIAKEIIKVLRPPQSPPKK